MTPRVIASGAVAVGVLCGAVVVQASRHAAALGADPLQPPQRLSETGLYVAGNLGVIDPRNHAFAPQYPLWSDGLIKRRWLQLPAGAAIDAHDEFAWEFPVGTRLWKEFSRGDRKVETRLLWKASSAGWVFGSYAWNADGTDAVLVPKEGIVTDVEVAPGRRHAIPSRADCATCHGPAAKAGPLGVNLLQLSPDRDPNALHGEPLREGMLTLPIAVHDGLVKGLASRWLAAPPRIRSSNADTRSVLGYMAANCSMCHNGNGEITALAPVIRYRDLLEDGDSVARSLVGQPTRWQLPGAADGSTVLVQAGAPEQSAMVARMRSRSPSTQMPPLGTVVRDQAAVDLVGRWISSELMRSH